MKRPLVYAVVFYIIGVTIGRYLPLSIGVVPFFFGVLLTCYYLFVKTNWKMVFIFFILFSLGYSLSLNTFFKKDNIINNLVENKTDVIINGRVVEISLTSTNKQKIKFAVEQLKYKQNKSENIYNNSFNISCVLKEDANVELGQIISLKAKLQNLDRVRNPGGFDEYLYLKGKNITYKAFPEIIEYGEVKKDFFVNMIHFRDRISTIYRQTLPEKEAGVIISMVLGDVSALDKDLKQLYIQNGIYHIISISGLHISTLSLALFYVLSLFLNKKTTSIIVIVFLVLYCVFSGSSPSAVRAVIMSSTMLFSYVIFRNNDFLTSIAFSCLCILIYNPVRLFDIGFQLSFLAVLGIAIVYVPIERAFVYIENKIYILKKILKFNFIREGFKIFISVSIFTYPVSCVYFYYAYPYGIFVNMIIVSTVSLLLFVGILVAFVGFFSLPLATFFSGILYYLLKIYEYVCLFFSSLPHSSTLVGHLSIFTVISYFVFVGLIIRMLYSRDSEFYFYKKLILYYTLGITIFIVGIGFFPKKLKVTMLDVGQGDCSVIEYNNNFFIIDGGGLINKEIGSNTGIYNLLPYLNYSNAKVIESIFVTHTDSDHILGIIEILDKKEIKNIFLPKAEYVDDELFDILKNVAEKNNISVHFVNNYDIIYSDENFNISCLYPFSETRTDTNNSSLVLKLEHKNLRFLFTGDIEEEAEKNILKKNIDISADVLKVAHHGSKTSSTLPFLQKVMPKVSLVSSGVNNSFSHPNKDVVKRLKDLGSEFFNTATDGAIIIESDGESLFIEKMLD